MILISSRGLAQNKSDFYEKAVDYITDQSIRFIKETLEIIT